MRTVLVLITAIFLFPAGFDPSLLEARPRARTPSRGSLTKRQLQKRLRREYSRPMAKLGTLGVYVKVLGGPVLFARKGRARLHPASCVKLVTSAAVLRSLGKEHRFDTVLRGRIAGGKMTTPLYLWGQGDPSLTRDDLARFAAHIKARGVTEIPAIVVDDTTFDRRRWPPGFRTPSSTGYMTPTGAVSLDGNTVEVVVEPTTAGQKAKVTVLPPSDYLEVKRPVKTGTRTHLMLVGVRRGRKLKVVVRGTIGAGSPPQRRWVRVLDPARYAGESLKRMLTIQGIRVGPVKTGRAARAPEILRHRSKPLSELVGVMNRTSNNFYAEQLLKALGGKSIGLPGSTRKGVRAARGLLTRSGIRRGRYSMANGSGLFGRTRFSPYQLVRLLERLHTLPWLYQALRSSLPVGGMTGTLAKRFGGGAAAGRVRAKTGTLNGVSCLAGFVDGRAGQRPIVFAILHNGFKMPHYRIRRVQDKMVEAMARYLRGRR